MFLYRQIDWRPCERGTGRRRSHSSCRPAASATRDRTPSPPLSSIGRMLPSHRSGGGTADAVDIGNGVATDVDRPVDRPVDRVP